MHRRSFLITPAVLLAAPPARPRLYFNSADIARLRPRSAEIVQRAERLLAGKPVPESVAEQGGGQHANYGQPSGQMSSMGLSLGLAWHLTGDKRYADKLREHLLHYVTYKRWYGQGLDQRVPPWHSELNTARFLYGYACGYDGIHTFLTPADRKTIADGMVRLGILPTLEDWILAETRIHALDSMGHNWWSVCVAMAGVACLALAGDDPRTEDWLTQINRGFEEWFAYKGNVLQNKPANFDPFYEGVGYANYALSEYLRFRLAHANVFPKRTQTRFRQLETATDFFVQTLYPTDTGYYTLNIGDSSLHVNASETVRLLIEAGFQHPHAGWYLKRTGSESLIARKPVPAALMPAKTAVLYDEIGWAVLRDSWKDNATLLAVRSGFTWNHVHADAGSFVLFHKGIPLITDSGACSYSHPAYTGYYVQSRAHNVVLFNGEGQPREDIRRGVRTPGRVYNLVEGEGLKYVYADATGPMSRYFTRNFRHWLWIDGTILIFDDIRAHEDGRLDWLLHYDGAAKVDGNRVRLENGAAKAELRFLYPTAVEAREEHGLRDHEPDKPFPYLAFSAPTRAREGKFIVAIQTQPSPIESLQAPNALGVRIGSTDIWLNLNADGRRMHENTNNTIDGWDTDAYLLAVSPSRIFVAAASYLRRGRKVMLNSLKKVEKVIKNA